MTGKKPEEKQRYSTAAVATQTETVFVDQETEEQISLPEMLVIIANDIAELKKKLL